MEEAKLTDLFTDVHNKLEEISADLQRHESNTMQPILTERATSLQQHQHDFMKLLASIPVNKANKDKVKALKVKMMKIAALSRESGSIQGELVLAGQMKELLTLLQRVNGFLSNAGDRNDQWCNGPDAEDPSWRRLAGSPNDELQQQLQPTSGEDTAPQSNHHDVGSIVSSQLAAQRDTASEDIKIGRKRNRLKRNGRRKDDPDTPTIATTVTLPAEVLQQPIDPSLAKVLKSIENTVTSPPPGPSQPAESVPIPSSQEELGSGLESGFSYAVAFSPGNASCCHRDFSMISDGTSRHADVSESNTSRGSMYEPIPSHTDSPAASVSSIPQSVLRDDDGTKAVHEGNISQSDPRGKLSSRDIDSGMVPDFDSTSRLGNVSGQPDPRLDSSNISGYVSPFNTDDPNLSNIFDGLDIRLSPSETSMHSFASFYSDYHRDAFSSRRPTREMYYPTKLKNCFQSPPAEASERAPQIFPSEVDNVSDVKLDQSSQSFGLNGFDVEIDGRFRNTGKYDGMENNRSNKFSQTNGYTKAVGLDLAASSDVSLRSLMFMVLSLMFLAGVCFYLKASGIDALLRYYSWWEVLEKHIDVTKAGDSTF